MFRLWAGITALSAAAERRIWTRTEQSELYCNLYTLLVAPPGVGKGMAIGPVEKMWHRAKGNVTGRLKVAPRSMTKASMIDEMARAQRRIPMNRFSNTPAMSVDLLEYSSLAILAEELGVLISTHDLDFLSALTVLYNNSPIYSETRRTGKISIEVFNPLITFLGGTQPAFLSNLLPEEAWGMGMMSRVVLIYSGKSVQKPLFPLDFDGNVVDLRLKALEKSLELDMGQILDLYGQVYWTEEARDEIVAWRAEGMPPIPTHSKLLHYNERRIMHIIKLSMIASLSRSNDLQITLSDFNRAKDWLLDAEMVMPDIFREMLGKSDGILIKELHMAMVAAYGRSGKKPLPAAFIWNFLQTRTTADRIERIINTAEKANIIARMAGTDTWTPRPSDEHGLE